MSLIYLLCFKRKAVNSSNSNKTVIHGASWKHADFGLVPKNENAMTNLLPTPKDTLQHKSPLTDAAM